MTSNTQRQIAANIHALCGLIGYSQAELARVTGISPAALSKKLRGLADWSLTDLDRIGDALSVSVSELAGSIPTAAEWDRRRSPLPAAPGPRFLAMPDVDDGLAFRAPLNFATPLSLIGAQGGRVQLDERTRLRSISSVCAGVG